MIMAYCELLHQKGLSLLEVLRHFYVIFIYMYVRQFKKIDFFEFVCHNRYYAESV